MVHAQPVLGAAPAPAALPPSAEAPVRRRNVRAVRRQSAKASVRRVTTPVRSRLEEDQARVAASRRSPVLTDPALVENLAAGGESAGGESAGLRGWGEGDDRSEENDDQEDGAGSGQSYEQAAQGRPDWVQ